MQEAIPQAVTSSEVQSMRGIISPALFLSLGLTPLLWGGAPEKQPAATQQIELLIEQLGDKDFRRREAASKALTALGAEALPVLQKERTHPDPEIRRRLDELIPPLERAIALAPKRVTLHAVNKPIQEIIAALTKQTGYKFGGLEPPHGERDQLVYTFHFDHLPFWQAMDQVCEASGYVLQQGYFGDDSLRLFHQPDSSVPFISYDGPFKVIATGFNYSRSNQFAQIVRNQPGSPASESLQVNLTLAAEPKLPVLRLGTVRLTAAEDEEKQSMLPSRTDIGHGGGRSFYYGGGYRSFVHQTQATLILPSRNSRIVKILKGIIPVTLLADQKPAVVTDHILSAKGKRFQAGVATFVIEEVSELAGKQYQIKMSVTEESKDGPNDWVRIQSRQQRIELQDAKGNKRPFYFNSMGTNGTNSATYTMVVQPNEDPKVGPPAKLVYYSWVLMEHEVAFAFRDLPLP
jgi:hypothetical protein